MKRISEKYGIEPITIPELYIQKLMRYEWPGNVRQLENFIERLLLLSDSVFDPGVFQELFQEIETHNLSKRSYPERVGGLERAGMGTVQEKIIDEVLLNAKFCKKRAAQMLGISRTTLWRKMKTLRAD